MNFTNETIRRQDRLLPETEALDLLVSGQYGVLSMVDVDGQGYGIPLNYVWDGGQSIYFHCAPQGEKLDNIASNCNVSFCVVGLTKVMPDKFTTQYESIVIKGSVVSTLPNDEKMKALELILDKYSPNDKEIGLKYSEKSFHRTAIIKLDIKSMSGKSKKCQL